MNSIQLSKLDLRLSDHWVEVMDTRAAAAAAARRRGMVGEGKSTSDTRRAQQGRVENSNTSSTSTSTRTLRKSKSFPANYFSLESLLVLVCLTASLLILPLILPPLPPPPFMLLLLPIGIFAVLMILAFMPSHTPNITASAASYV